MSFWPFSLFSKKKQSSQDFYSASFESKETLGTKIKKVFGVKGVDLSELSVLEDVLVKADIGPTIASEIIDSIKNKNLKSTEDAISLIEDILKDSIIQPEGELTGEGLTIIMVLGVNGVGKTTSIAKLANYYKNIGKKIVIAAADTFRAAAVEQLELWGKRVDIPVISQHQGADAASVVYDALESAIARKVDLLIIDTAGRLHNKQGLMDELKKIDRVINSKTGGSGFIKKNLIVIDSNTGQNAFNQAQSFNEAVGVDGAILTKYDAKGKGGIVFNIYTKLKIPFYFIGTGEKIDDFMKFDRDQFVGNICR